MAKKQTKKKSSRKKSKKKLTKSEQIARKPIEKIIKEYGRKGGEAKVRQYLRTLQTGYRARVRQFARHDAVSGAQIQYELARPKDWKMPSPAKLSYNQLILEITRLQQFFRSKTSTLEGIEKVNKKQDISIFGRDRKTGKPKYSMTSEERDKFWRLYNEFYNQKSLAIGIYDSKDTKIILGRMLRGDYDKEEYDALRAEDVDSVDELTPDMLTDFLNRLQSKLDQERRAKTRGIPNVYRGRRDSRKT